MKLIYIFCINFGCSVHKKPILFYFLWKVTLQRLYNMLWKIGAPKYFLVDFSHANQLETLSNISKLWVLAEILIKQLKIWQNDWNQKQHLRLSVLIHVYPSWCGFSQKVIGSCDVVLYANKTMLLYVYSSVPRENCLLLNIEKKRYFEGNVEGIDVYYWYVQYNLISNS